MISMKQNLGHVVAALVVFATPAVALAAGSGPLEGLTSFFIAGGTEETPTGERPATNAEQWPGEKDQATEAAPMAEHAGVGMKIDEDINGGSVFAPDDKGIPVVSKSVFLSSGHIADSFAPFAEVIDGTFSDQNIFSGPEDIVYLSRGEKDGVKVGDQFSVVHEGSEMTDPTSGDKLGVMIFVDGVVEVTETADDNAVALIIASYDTIERGDSLVRREATEVPTIDPDAPLADKKINARIVTGGATKKGFASDDVIYLSAGTNQGVAIGDVFDIIGEEEVTRRDGSVAAGLPKFRAQARVFDTKARTSAALIINSIASVSRGNLATYTLSR